MGVEPFLVSSSVECFIAQRLVRLICPKCKNKVTPRQEIMRDFGAVDVDISQVTFYEGKGCEFCKFTGYKGRTGIYEFLAVNDQIREMILQRTSSNLIKKKAIELGMRTLRQDGWDKVKRGLTTISEVIRVTQQEELPE
jgi:type II secretory ATPase GspE/PulE/Tfp pilus assembly ATPase PilB-like protein